MAFHAKFVRSRLGVLRVMAVIAALLLLELPALAQVVPGAKPPNTKLRGRRQGVVVDLREKNFGTLDASQFEEYFNDYYLQQFVQPADTRTRTLGELRIELRNQYLGTGRSGPPYNRLADMTFSFMQAILRGDFDMEIKYNAMMMIGDLNESEGDIAQGTKPKPYSKALDLMIRVYRSPKAPDYLRVPALLGIMRHAELHSSSPMTAEQRDLVLHAMADLLNEKAAPENRTAEAQAWLRRLAAQILGNMGEPGFAGGSTEIVKLLWNTMRDSKPDNPWSVRFSAALALPDIKLPASAKLDVQGMCMDAIELFNSFAKSEVEQAREENTDPNRRRLWAAYFNVKSALAGVSGKPGLIASLPESKRDEMLTPLRKLFSDLQKVLDKDPIRATELLAVIEKLQAIVKQFRKGTPVVAPDSGGRPKNEENPAGEAVPVNASPVPATRR